MRMQVSRLCTNSLKCMPTESVFGELMQRNARGAGASAAGIKTSKLTDCSEESAHSVAFSASWQEVDSSVFGMARDGRPRKGWAGMPRIGRWHTVKVSADGHGESTCSDIRVETSRMSQRPAPRPMKAVWLRGSEAAEDGVWTGKARASFVQEARMDVTGDTDGDAAAVEMSLLNGEGGGATPALGVTAAMADVTNTVSELRGEQALEAGMMGARNETNSRASCIHVRAEIQSMNVTYRRLQRSVIVTWVLQCTGETIAGDNGCVEWMHVCARSCGCASFMSLSCIQCTHVVRTINIFYHGGGGGGCCCC